MTTTPNSSGFLFSSTPSPARSLIIIILLLPLLEISYSMTSRLRHDTAIFDQSALFQVDEL
jgi:hypothetical protein